MQRLTRLPLVAGAAIALLMIPIVALSADSIQVASDLTTKNVRTEESNLADVVADAIRAVDKADASFVLASAFTETVVPKGTAAKEGVLKALDFRDDTVSVVKLKGAQIRKALEHGLSLYPQKNPAFLQVSGLTVTIDPAGDRDKRVLSINVGKNALVDDKTYTVAMPTPLANGALAYFKVWTKTDVDHTSDKTLAQALTDYLTANKTIGAKGDDRIVFKK